MAKKPKEEVSQDQAASAPAVAPVRTVDGVPFADIKTAILKNHGGHETADDEGLIRLWRSLPKKAQISYLEPPAAPEAKEMADDSSGSKADV